MEISQNFYEEIALWVGVFIIVLAMSVQTGEPITLTTILIVAAFVIRLIIKQKRPDVDELIDVKLENKLKE